MKPTLTRHLVFTAAIALLALSAAPSGAALGHWDRITFSGPVALPGVVLPAGSYTFEIANPETSLRVVRVSRSDTGRAIRAACGFRSFGPRAEITMQYVRAFRSAASRAPSSSLSRFSRL